MRGTHEKVLLEKYYFYLLFKFFFFINFDAVVFNEIFFGTKTFDFQKKMLESMRNFCFMRILITLEILILITFEIFLM